MKSPLGLGRAGLAAAVLAAGIITGPLMSRPAHAYASCRSDPVVTLSNLGTLDLNASIGDSLSDVQKVVYVVHAPAGTKLLAVVNTDTLIGLHESVQFYADDSANTFDVYTTVYTGQKGISVTASSTVLSLLNIVLGSSAVTGSSNQALHTHFKTLL